MPLAAWMTMVAATSAFAGTATPWRAELVPARETTLFDDAAALLGRGYYDVEFRRNRLPDLIRRYRALAEAARSVEEERAIVREFLRQLPASHLALYSNATYELLMAELSCTARPTLGCQLTRLGDDYYVDWILEGGPAQRAGLRRGDRVLAIDGESPRASLRLDWASDDAALPDPALHGLLCDEDEDVELWVERTPGTRSRGWITAERYSACDASRASARVIEDGGRFGYVHLWFVVDGESSGLIRGLIEGEFADCDGLLLDLRGRGGSASEVRRVVQALVRKGTWERPIVVLTDAGTRSAKEIIAYELQDRRAALVVGEQTAGAVIPASFERVGQGGVLMFPRMTLPPYTQLLEGQGVTPDVWASAPLPFSNGEDPILDAGIVALQVWSGER